MANMTVTSTSRLISDLETIYPKERILQKASELAVYESDALTAFRSRPLAVVLPINTEEVIETVRLCSQKRVPFVARGSGTSLSGGSLPVESGIVIALNRLNRILELDARQRFAVVEPGVVNVQVSQAASRHRLYYAPDPSSQSICTIGGNIAFNSGGAHCLKHGMTSNHILGIKAVLGDGTVVKLGGKSLENNGPDLTGFFVGSEGLFGIALEITLRLIPKPEVFETVMASYSSLESAGQAVSRVVAAGLLPGAMEIMDRLALKAAEAAVGSQYPKSAGAVLIVELEGEKEEVAAEFEALHKVIAASNPIEFQVAADEDQRLQIWKGRKCAFSAVGHLSPDYIVQDGVVPRSRLGEALAEVQRLSGKYGMEVANVFHAGDGNLHPLILFDGSQPGSLEKAEELAGEILEMCIRLGGSITGEHGVGMEKRTYLSRMFSSADIQQMHAFRRAVDPAEIANPGKMLIPGSVSDVLEPEISIAAPPAEEEMLQPTSVEEIQEAVSNYRQLFVTAGQTKPGLIPSREGCNLDLRKISGIIEYDPSEFTITARAGASIQEIQLVLAENGQFLPFDPPLAESGATLGGTIAAGISGPGRFRYGGIRDFILGVEIVNGRGQKIKGGGRVVKNAAGFDLPRLLVGSRGSLGVILQATFKVFPRPESYSTLRVSYTSPSEALSHILEAGSVSDVTLEAVEWEPPSTVFFRIGGRSMSLPGRFQRLGQRVGSGELLEGEEEYQYWNDLLHFRWVPNGWSLARLPLVPVSIPALEERLASFNCRYHYGCGGNVLFIAWQGPADWLSEIGDSEVNPLYLRGGSPRSSVPTGALPFASRIKQALDPEGRFPAI